MNDDLWLRLAGIALRLPGVGKRSIRVTRMESGEFCATAQINITSGEGSVECACAFGPSQDTAMAALEARLLSGKP